MNDTAIDHLYRAGIGSLTDDELFDETLDRSDDYEDAGMACCYSEIERRVVAGLADPGLKNFYEFIRPDFTKQVLSVVVPDYIVYAVMRHRGQA